MADATTPRNFDDGSITFSDDGGNSAVIANIHGTYAISEFPPDGRESVTSQVQGAYIGARRGDRVPVEITISGVATRFDGDADQIINGTIAGYVSTTDDIGDEKRCDVQVDETYGTDTRGFTLDDCLVTRAYTAGKPGEFSYKISGIGAFTLDGVTVIASR